MPGNTWPPVYPKHEGSTGADEPQDRIDFIDYAGDKLTVKDSVSFVEGDPKPVPDQAGNAWPTLTASQRHSVRCTFVLEAWARGRTTSRSMLTWLGRVTAQPIVSATSSAVSGASTPA